MWKTVKLGDTIEIARGGSPRPIKSFITTEDDGVNWIKIGDTEQGGRYIHTTKEKIKPSGVSRSRYVKENDFLLSNSMSFGRPYILKTSGCIHDGWLVLSEYQELFSADYLYYLLSSSLVQNQFERLARGSTVRNLNIDLVSQVTVPLPPLAEQQRIVAKLDAAFAEIDGAIEVLENNNNQGRKLFQRVLSDLISKKSENDSSLTLKEIAKFLDYRGKTPPKTESGIKLLTAKNVRMGFIKNQPEEFVSEEGYKEHMTRGFPKVGDVIFTTEAPLGLVAQIENDSFALGQRLITFQILNDVMKSTYLKFALMSEPYQKIILEKGTGATVKGIKASLLKEIKITFPVSVDEQANRIAVIEEVEKHCNDLANNYTKQVSSYQSLKSAILAQELQSEAA